MQNTLVEPLKEACSRLGRKNWITYKDRDNRRSDKYAHKQKWCVTVLSEEEMALKEGQLERTFAERRAEEDRKAEDIHRHAAAGVPIQQPKTV